MLFGSKEPDIFDAHNMYVEGKYIKALHAYEEYYARNSDSLSAIRMMANIYLMSEDRAKGESLLIKLAERFLSSERYYDALSIISKLMIISLDKPRFYRMAADVYEKMGREKLAMRYLFQLADMYRSAGKFAECSAQLMEIAKRNLDDKRLIIKVMRKLTVLGSHKELSEILTDCAKSSVLSDFEVDDMVVYLLESNCQPQLVMPFLKDFIKRNPENFYIAEEMLTTYFSRNFNVAEFEDIVSVAPPAATYKMSMSIKEAVADKAVFTHLLYLESLNGDRDRIKGLILEMYLENTLDIDDIEKICKKTGCCIALEEAKKMIPSKETKPVEEEEAVSEKIVIPEPEPVPVAAAELETFEKTGEITEYEPISLDSFAVEDTPSKVNTAIDIADDFGLAPQESNADTSFSGFETFDFSPEKNEVQGAFSGFDDEPEQNIAINDNDFFDNSAPKNSGETAQPFDMSDVEIDAQHSTDIFDGMVEEKKELKKETVNEIHFDASELKPSSDKPEDDFFLKEMEG